MTRSRRRYVLDDSQSISGAKATCSWRKGCRLRICFCVRRPFFSPSPSLRSCNVYQKEVDFQSIYLRLKLIENTCGNARRSPFSQLLSGVWERGRAHICVVSDCLFHREKSSLRYYDSSLSFGPSLIFFFLGKLQGFKF